MKNPREDKRSLLLSALWAQLFFAGGALLLLLVCSAVAASMEDPDPVLRPLALAALYLSSVVCGFASVRLSGDGIMSGLLSGCFAAVLVFLLSLLPLPDSPCAFPASLCLTLLVIPASGVGALLGHRRRDAAPKHKPKYPR